MPGIYRMACGSCEYEVEGIMSITYVIKDDGSEEICPHPAEGSRAEKATGKSWGELSRANRIVYRYALVCLACGELDYYGPRDSSPGARSGGHIGGIVHQPSSDDAAVHVCRSCGQMRLIPLCGDTGCLLALLELVRLRRKRIHACPRCNVGALRTELTAIS